LGEEGRDSRTFQAQISRRQISYFRDLAGIPEQLAGQHAIALRQLSSLRQKSHNVIIVIRR